MTKDYTKLSIVELKNEYKNGLKVEDVTMQCLNRIKETEPAIDALITVCADTALSKARSLDKEGYNENSLLWGVPLTVKDALCTKNVRTTSGSRILGNFIPPYDAYAVKKLKEANALILGKNNMDEFAMGSSCENSAFKKTKNPHDIRKVPGGSSGGSAASVAARQSFASLGTDTGGSIRQPAALCGCVGLKPTYGRVSRYGVIAYGSSLDQVGPFARSVEDAALMLEAIAGYDPMDSTSAQVEVPAYSKLIHEKSSLKNVTFGIPREFMEGATLDKEMAAACQNTVAMAKELGAEVVEVSLPHTKYALSCYYIIATAEAGSNLARFDGVRYGHRAENIKDLDELYVKSRTEGFGEEVQRRILLGAFVLSSGYYDAYYKKAAQVRRLIREDYEKALTQCDVLLAPVSPVPAWDIGQVHDPVQMYLMDIFTLSLNLAGLPGLSLPVGISKNKLPLGMQLMGRAFDEASLLTYGHLLTKGLKTDCIFADI